jgi:hypothetical protein
MGIAIEKKGKKGNEMKIKIRRWTYSIYTHKNIKLTKVSDISEMTNYRFLLLTQRKETQQV